MVRAGTSARHAVAFFVAAVTVLLACAAHAQIWAYTDEYGRTYYTDTPPHEGYERYKPKGELRGYRLRATGAYDPAIKRASGKHGVSAALVKAVIAAESGFDPLARSSKGAQGLMQLMPGTARDLGVADALDPWQNIDGGTKYLGEMIERYPGELALALAAYNAGPEAVKRHRGVPPYRETRSYVKRVLNFYKKYHADFRP